MKLFSASSHRPHGAAGRIAGACLFAGTNLIGVFGAYQNLCVFIGKCFGIQRFKFYVFAGASLLGKDVALCIRNFLPTDGDVIPCSLQLRSWLG